MVARGGNAPPSAGCGPAALLLSYRAIEKMAPAPGYAPGFSDRKSDVLLLHHAGKEMWRSTEDSNLGRLKQARLFSGQLPRPSRTCSVNGTSEMAPRRGLAPRHSA